MRIEFLGLPGAGKTTIRQALLNHLKNIDDERYLSTEEAFYQIIKCDGDRIYRVLLSALPYRAGLKFSKNINGRSLYQINAQNRFLAKHGGSLEAFLSSTVFESMSIEDKKNVIGSFLEMGSLSEVLDHSSLDNSVIFFEEGFVQKTFMFVDHEYSFKQIQTSLQKYLRSVPQPDIVVHVKANTAISHQRMLGRKEGLTNRLKQSNEQVIDSFLKSAEEHISNVREILSTKDDCKVIEVVNEDDLGSVVGTLVGQLDSLGKL